MHPCKTIYAVVPNIAIFTNEIASLFDNCTNNSENFGPDNKNLNPTAVELIEHKLFDINNNVSFWYPQQYSQNVLEGKATFYAGYTNR